MLLTHQDLCSLGEQLFRESTNQFYPDGHQEDYYQDVQPSNSPAHTLTCSMPPYAHSPELGCIGSIVQEYCFYGFPQELFCAYLYVVYHGCIYRFKIYALICRGIQLIREEYLPLSLPSAFENSVWQQYQTCELTFIAVKIAVNPLQVGIWTSGHARLEDEWKANTHKKAWRNLPFRLPPAT